MDIDELPERQLDREVARRVLGLAVEPRTNSRTGEQDFVYAVGPEAWVRVPSYTAGMHGALAIDGALAQRRWRRTEPRDLHPAPPGDVRVVYEHSDGRRVEATGWLNLALCRAALKAVSA